MKMQNNKEFEKCKITSTEAAIVIILGILAVILPNVSTIFSNLPELGIGTIVGWISLLSGITYGVFSFLTKDRKTILPRSLQSVFYTSIGIYLLAFSSIGHLPIGFILVMFFLLSSVFRILYASKMRPRNGTGWLSLFCITDILMALMVALNYPSSAGWARGLMFGICILSHGLTTTLTSPYKKRQNLSQPLQA